MTAALELIAVAVGGSGSTFFAQSVSAWWKGRGERYRVDREVDADLETERGKLTLELLRAARDEAAAVRAETVSIHAVHLEEALDHLYALLHAEGPAERRAAERRARAFLRRMRPEPGEKRNEVQTEISAERLKQDAKKGGGE